MAAYRVQHGDTLSAIARAHGMSLAQLEKLNPQFAHNWNSIMPGQDVNLMPAGRPPAGKAPARPGAKAPGKAPAKPAPPLSPYQTLLNKLKGVGGTERDAYAALTTLFTSYGLSSLAPKILDFLQQGFGADTITTLLQQTPEYQARFSGNAERIKQGLQVLTPAEYLSTEASYKQLLRVGGLDPSLQSQKQFADWIANDVSPTELQNRVNLAVQATTQAPPELISAFSQMGIHHGDLASYFLNKNTPMPQLQQKMNQAQIIQAGHQAGLKSVDTNAAGLYAQEGVTYNQAQSAYQKIAQVLPEAQKLSSIYGKQAGYGQTEAEQETLGNSGTAQLKREALGQQEQATFAGKAGTGQKSFVQQTAGTGF
jgi:LysM repeat protein